MTPNRLVSHLPKTLPLDLNRPPLPTTLNRPPPVHPTPHHIIHHRSICAYAHGAHNCAVLLAAAGDGAEILERRVVMAGAEWSTACLRASGGSQLVVPDAAQVRGGARRAGGCFVIKQTAAGCDTQPTSVA